MELKIIVSKLARFKAFFYSAIVGLSFSHTVTALKWIDLEIWNYYSIDYFKSTCYPFFNNCTALSFSDVTPIKYLIFIYLILSVLIYIPLIFKKNKLTYVLFFFLFIIKAGLFLSRYNVMGNYHNMHLALVIIFLILPRASFFYRITLCLQYFWAGTLKLNIEWLSGAAFVKYPSFFQGEFYLLSLSYVVILELVLCWGLISKNSFLRRLTLVQLIIFHAYSYSIVGAFYPLIMLGILFPILIEDFLKVNQKRYFISFKYFFKDLEGVKKFSINFLPSIIFILCFFFYNLSVKFSNIDPAKDGEIRSLSLNMLDAKTSCNTKLVQKFEDGNLRFLNIPNLEDSIRIKCDPITFQSYIRKLCLEIAKDVLKSKLYFHLETRRFTELKFETIRATQDICEQ